MPVYRLPVTLTWDDPGSPGVNVWHLRTTGGAGDAADRQSAVDSIHEFYGDLATAGSGRPFRHELVITADAVTDVEDQEQSPVDWLQFNVTNSTADAPMVCQLCVSWKTSSVSRRGRGRTFIGPLSREVEDTNGTPTPGAVTTLQNAATALAERNDNINGWAVGVYGLQTAGGGPTSPHVLRDITAATVRDTFAILRSRRD